MIPEPEHTTKCFTHRRRQLLTVLVIGCVVWLLAPGCFSFDNPLVVEVPEYEPQLTVSCYLVPGRKYELLLTDSKSAYEPVSDTSTLNFLLNEILVDDALVTISHHGQIDTLDFRGDGRYWNDNPVPQDYNELFTLNVHAVDGRHLTGETTIKPPVLVDSIEFIPGGTGKYAAVTYFTPPDDGRDEHFFLQISSVWRLFGPSPQNLYSDALYDGRTSPWITEYDFAPGDTVHFRLMHIHEEHYEFVRTYENAAEASFRPFAEPGPVKHNVTGGYGIFTGFDSIEYLDSVPK